MIRITFLFVIIVPALVATGAAFAQPGPPPESSAAPEGSRFGPKTSLAAEALLLEIDDADIDLQVERDGESSIRSSEPLLIAKNGGLLTLTRTPRPANGGRAKRIQVEIVLEPTQSVAIVGAGLNVDALDPLLPADEAAVQASLPKPPTPVAAVLDGGRDDVNTGGEDGDEDIPDGDKDMADGAKPKWRAGYGVWQLRVEGTRATLRGLRNLDLEVRTSETVVQSTGGTLVATVNEGRFESTGHRGKLDLLITDGVAEVESHRGPLKIDQLGGAVQLVGGEGRTVARVAEGDLRVDGRAGRLTVDGEAGLIDLRGLQSSTTQVLGKNHQVRLSESEVPFHSSQQGGRLEVRGGSRTLFLDGATQLEAEVVEFEGLIQGSLSGGELILRSPAARLHLDAVDARVAFEGLKQLQLGGQGLEVSGRGIVAIQRFELVDSDVEIDLRDLVHDPHLMLAGGTIARFEMASPCVVKVGGSPSLAPRVDVIGCDLRGLEQSRVGARERERYGEGLRRLTLMLSGEPEVQVEGR